MGKKASNPPPPKCNSCANGFNGRNGNGYQPCGCMPKPPPAPPRNKSSVIVVIS